MKKFRAAALAAACMTLLSCTSATKGTTADGSTWTELASGISFTEFRDTEAHARCRLVRIDLHGRNLTVCAYPDSGTECTATERFLLLGGKKTHTFAAEQGCTVAMNSTPFRAHGSGKKSLVGTHFFAGTEYGIPIARYAALALYREGDALRAQVFASQDDACSAAGTPLLVSGGFFALLTDGVPAAFSGTARNSRTAAGVADGGRTLFLLCARKTSPHGGLDFAGCARILAEAGCTDALLFDGGNSSSLFIQERGSRPRTWHNPLIFPAASIGFSLTHE